MKFYEILGLNTPLKGDVGIEIEAETLSDEVFPQRTDALREFWRAEADGSLRGNSIEYVFKKPFSLKESKKALLVLREALDSRNIVIEDSIRAGVHVHVNCQDMTCEQVLRFIAIYYSLENILVKWCGKNRTNNLFCLRNMDAEGAIMRVANSLRGPEWASGLVSNNIRYASLNASSLMKYGSLEFRALRTENDFTKTYKWAELLVHLKNKSLEFSSVEEVLEQFSMQGPRGWAEDILGDFYEEVSNYENFEKEVWVGIRYAQDLLFYNM